MSTSTPETMMLALRIDSFVLCAVLEITSAGARVEETSTTIPISVSSRIRGVTQPHKNTRLTSNFERCSVTFTREGVVL